MLSFVKIVKIMVVGVCLAFKADVTVCPIPIPVLNKPEKELKAIPEKKEKQQHFLLLSAVNLFVNQQAWRYLIALLNEKQPDKHHSGISLWWKHLALNYLHNYLSVIDTSIHI